MLHPTVPFCSHMSQASSDELFVSFPVYPSKRHTVLLEFIGTKIFFKLTFEGHELIYMGL